MTTDKKRFVYVFGYNDVFAFRYLLRLKLQRSLSNRTVGERSEPLITAFLLTRARRCDVETTNGITDLGELDLNL